MEITLEKIELVKDRTGVTYAEAKQALEEADGSVVDAIISIEERVNSEFEGVTAENFKDSAAYQKMKALVDKGNMSRIVIKKDEEIIMNFPLTAGVVGAIIVPWGVIFGIIATIGFKCKVEFINSDGETVDINGKVVDTYNKAVDAGKKAADMGQDVIDRLKETEAYETIRSKGQEAYTEFTAEGGKAEKFNEWAQEKSAKIDEFVGDVSDRIKSEIDRFDDSKLKDVFDDIKKYTDDLLKKKEGSEESVSDVDASCDIDDVIDEIDAEESEDK